MRILKKALSAFLLLCVVFIMLFLSALPNTKPYVPTGPEGPEVHAKRMRHKFSGKLHESLQSFYQLQYLNRTAYEGHTLAIALFNVNYHIKALEEQPGQAPQFSDEARKSKDQLKEAEVYRIKVLRQHLSPDEGRELEAMQSFERRQWQLVVQYLQELFRCIVVNHELNELIKTDEARYQRGQERFLSAGDRLEYYRQMEQFYSMVALPGIICWGEDLGKDVPKFMPQSLILYGVTKELRLIHDTTENSLVIYRKAADKYDELIQGSKQIKRHISDVVLPMIRQTMDSIKTELN